MSYHIALSEDGKFLICRVIGPMTAGIARESSKELNQLSQVTKIKRFLTDVRESKNVSDSFENYGYAYKDMKDLDLQRDVRAAILINPSDRSHDFVETVCQNAGYNVRIFCEEEAAVAWLNEETDC